MLFGLGVISRCFRSGLGESRALGVLLGRSLSLWFRRISKGRRGVVLLGIAVRLKFVGSGGDRTLEPPSGGDGASIGIIKFSSGVSSGEREGSFILTGTFSLLEFRRADREYGGDS